MHHSKSVLNTDCIVNAGHNKATHRFRKSTSAKRQRSSSIETEYVLAREQRDAILVGVRAAHTALLHTSRMFLYKKRK